MSVRFEDKHLQRFSAASWDFNPLHLSEDYARKSAYGERVVFGMLGCLAALAETPLPQGRIVRAAIIDFKAPLLLGVSYNVIAKEERSGGWKVMLMDGSAASLVMRLTLEDGTPELARLPESGMAPQPHARRLQVADLVPELSFSGEYSPRRVAYAELLDLLGVNREAWGDSLLLTLLATSYVTGMELPGESAAFVGLRAEFAPGPPQTPSHFQVALNSYDERFGFVESRFSLAGETGTYAQGEITAVARPSPVRTELTRLLKGSGRFAGKTAVVIGASRGLGAALALQLAADGCTVIGIYGKSRDAAEEMAAASKDLPGRLLMEQGDPADIDWCVALKDRIRAEFASLDLLICSAAPPLQSLKLEEAAYHRISAYLQTGFALVCAPLTAFMELASNSRGTVLLISSSAVEEPPGVWPHYIALKFAAEGIARSAAASNSKVRFIIARPGKLRTDLTNTPAGWLDAEEPEVVAGRLVAAVAEHGEPGTVHFCR